jgi:hypothetical protein
MMMWVVAAMAAAATAEKSSVDVRLDEIEQKIEQTLQQLSSHSTPSARARTALNNRAKPNLLHKKQSTKASIAKQPEKICWGVKDPAQHCVVKQWENGGQKPDGAGWHVRNMSECDAVDHINECSSTASGAYSACWKKPDGSKCWVDQTNKTTMGLMPKTEGAEGVPLNECSSAPECDIGDLTVVVVLQAQNCSATAECSYTDDHDCLPVGCPCSLFSDDCQEDTHCVDPDSWTEHVPLFAQWTTGRSCRYYDTIDTVVDVGLAVGAAVAAGAVACFLTAGGACAAFGAADETASALDSLADAGRAAGNEAYSQLLKDQSAIVQNVFDNVLDPSKGLAKILP